MRISDWSSDVCSSDLIGGNFAGLCKGHHALMTRSTRQTIESLRRDRTNTNVGSLGLLDKRLHALVAPGRFDIQFFNRVRRMAQASDDRMKAGQNLVRRNCFPLKYACYAHGAPRSKEHTS